MTPLKNEITQTHSIFSTLVSKLYYLIIPNSVYTVKLNLDFAQISQLSIAKITEVDPATLHHFSNIK